MFRYSAFRCWNQSLHVFASMWESCSILSSPILPFLHYSPNTYSMFEGIPDTPWNNCQMISVHHVAKSMVFWLCCKGKACCHFDYLPSAINVSDLSQSYCITLMTRSVNLHINLYYHNATHFITIQQQWVKELERRGYGYKLRLINRCKASSRHIMTVNLACHLEGI